MKSFFVLIIITLTLFSFSLCTSKSRNNKQKIDIATYQNYIQKGDKISNMAQGILLANVGKAIKNGGIEYAVQFCNLQASSIIDSLNRANNAIISRISIKNRNPQNNLKDDLEKQLWAAFAEQFKLGTANDTVIRLNNKLVFYKPIKTAMPTCLKCHGNPEFDIEPATLVNIQNLYPNDLATGYKLNDFRGLWKIEFSE